MGEYVTGHRDLWRRELQRRFQNIEEETKSVLLVVNVMDGHPKDSEADKEIRRMGLKNSLGCWRISYQRKRRSRTRVEPYNLIRTVLIM